MSNRVAGPYRDCMRSVTALAAYASLLAFGTYQTFRPTFDSHFARVQTERGDGMLNHYILEHTWQVLANPDYCGSLFSPPFFFPERSTLWYSEHLLGVAPLYWGLRLALPHDLAYQWWQIILDALNFVAFAAVARRLRCPHVLALAGGYLWAFGLVHVDQIKHQQMIPRLWMPLAAYYAWSFARVPTARALNRMLACLFLQGVSCANTGWFLGAGLATFLPLAIGLRPGGWAETVRFARGNWWRVARIVGGWTAALAIAFVPYFVVNWGQERKYLECYGLMPTPAAWLTGPPGTPWDQTLGPRATDPTLPPPGLRSWVSDECYLFCGFAIYALMLAAAAHRLVARRPDRSPESAVIAAGLLTAAIWMLLTLTLGQAGHSLWELVRCVPGSKSIRCVSRVYVVVYLFGSLAALVWLARTTELLRPRVRWALLALVAVAIIGEQIGYDPPSFEKQDFYPLADRTAEQLRGADVGYVLPAFTDTSGHKSLNVYGEVFGMWVGMRANVPVVNGYSGRTPPGDFPFAAPADDDSLRRWLSGRFRGRLAIITPDRPDKLRFITIE